MLNKLIKSANAETLAARELAELAGKEVRARDFLVPLGLGGAGAMGGYTLSDPEHRRRNALLMGLGGLGVGGVGAYAGRSGIGKSVMEAAIAKNINKDLKPEAAAKILTGEEGGLKDLFLLNKKNTFRTSDYEALSKLREHPVWVKNSPVHQDMGRVVDSMRETMEKARNARPLADEFELDSVLPHHSKFLSTIDDLDPDWVRNVIRHSKKASVVGNFARSHPLTTLAIMVPTGALVGEMASPGLKNDRKYRFRGMGAGAFLSLVPHLSRA